MLAIKAKASSVASMTSRMGRALAPPTLSAPLGNISLDYSLYIVWAYGGHGRLGVGGRDMFERNPLLEETARLETRARERIKLAAVEMGLAGQQRVVDLHGDQIVNFEGIPQQIAAIARKHGDAAREREVEARRTHNARRRLGGFDAGESEAPKRGGQAPGAEADRERILAGLQAEGGDGGESNSAMAL